MSKSLYTKYRPQKFEDVIGQKVVKDILTNSIQKDKINHAYLLFGIRGTGKTTLARIFAKAVNCEDRQGVEPCDQCNSCVEIRNGSSLDVIEIDAASNNGVEEIRQIKENTSYMTTSSKYKVYIIDEVHMLSKAAFNALLKTLEEPPSNTIFILATTEMNRIPETILSRSLVLNLEELRKNDIKEGIELILKKENIEYEKESIEYITRVSRGSLRDAISSLEAVLLYSPSKVTVKSVVDALGLVEIDELRRMIITDHDALHKFISSTEKDTRKILNLLIEVVTEEIREGKTYLTPLLNDLVSILISISDPSVIKLAILSSIAKNKEHIEKHRSPNDVKIEKKVVEETIEEEVIVEEEPIEEEVVEEEVVVEEEPKIPTASTEEVELLETPTVEVKYADELIKRQGLKDKIENKEIVVEKKDVEIELENVSEEEVEEPTKEQTSIEDELIEQIDEKTQEVDLESIQKIDDLEEKQKEADIEKRESTSEQSIIEPTEENVIQEPTEEVVTTKTINDFVGGSEYATVLFEHKDPMKSKIQSRFNYADSYGANKKYKKYIKFLKNGKVVAVNDQALILGISDMELYNDLKQVTLEKELIDFVEELSGERLYILPVTNENWTLIVRMYKKAKQDGKVVQKRINIPEDSFTVKEKTNEFKKIFGDKLK